MTSEYILDSTLAFETLLPLKTVINGGWKLDQGNSSSNQTIVQINPL